MGQHKPTANIGPTWPHKGPRSAQQVRKMGPTGPNIPQHTPDSDPTLPKIGDIDVYLVAKVISPKFLKAMKNMQNSAKNACFFLAQFVHRIGFVTPTYWNILSVSCKQCNVIPMFDLSQPSWQHLALMLRLFRPMSTMLARVL